MKEQIISLVREYSNHEIPEDTSFNLIEAGLLDSLAMMNLVAVFEDELDIELDAEDISKSNFSTVDAMAELITRKRQWK